MQNNLLPIVVKRSEEGPYMKESDFEKSLSKHTAELVKKHGLKFNPQTPVPWDDDMADRLYQAGLELFLEMGVYNQSTERCILFGRSEVEELVGKVRNRLVLGTGKDTVVMQRRDVEGYDPGCCAEWSDRHTMQ